MDFGFICRCPNQEILTTECDILAPCALGGVIDGMLVQKLKCPIVCGAANNILGDPEEPLLKIALDNIRGIQTSISQTEDYKQIDKPTDEIYQRIEVNKKAIE